MLKESSIIVVVSNVLRDELISKGYNESKIIVIPNGVDIQKFRNITNNDIANKINLSKDKITIGFSGLLVFGMVLIHWRTQLKLLMILKKSIVNF